MKGFETGIEQIDKVFRGLKDGKLYCVLCPLEEDTTDLIAKMTMGVATRDNSVLLLSTDNDRKKMFNMLFDIFWRFCDADTQFDGIERRHLMLYKMGKLPIWIEDAKEQSYTSILAVLQRICILNKHAISIILIDNFTHIKTAFQAFDEETTIQANLYLLKMIAKIRNIPIVAFCHWQADKLFTQSEYIDKKIVIQPEFVSMNVLIPTPLISDP